MSGDSSSAFTQDNVFTFKEGDSLPTPTTSKNDLIPLQSTPVLGSDSLITAAVSVEPLKDKEKSDNEKDEIPLSDLNEFILNNNSRRNSENDKTLKINDDQSSNQSKNLSLLNDSKEKLDGKTEIKDKSDTEDQEDDSCIVNCLYYTMKCCECTIM